MTTCPENAATALPRRLIGAATALLLLASLVPSVAADEPPLPDSGDPTDRHDLPDQDAVCGAGAELSWGCAVVRAREAVDASAYPWSAIGRVNFASIEVRQHCTGALVGPRLVLTAAHCLYSRARRTWVPAASLRFVAGYQRGSQMAFSAGIRYFLSRAQDPSGRDFSAGSGTDWALLELAEPIGELAGWLGTEVLDQAGLDRARRAGAALAFAGYPNARPHVLMLDPDCDPARFAGEDALLLNHCAAMTGDSGAPVLLTGDGPPRVVAVMIGISRSGDDPLGVATPVAGFREALIGALGAVGIGPTTEGRAPAQD